ncbi:MULTISPECIES: SDR family oxidoreductase [unclassified Janthinobacterium]|uniref:SDR family oxidoreductase n=1 Tax=unclassified Janthinobacterium TaxID=2610881 RepID=UPI000349E86F|nr:MULTISPECIES: SDR family oxidoreductase [unclassified Janthinobacterium]MEC5160823.1 NAD(P)-dependent dehydrogenase (short-subunit alcohol dehydrogenase family) [Janthinobacterium sp. CG_S6]
MRTTQELFSLVGKTALVTGGSRGLGLQMALALGEQGATVVIAARKQADLDEALAFLAERKVSAYAVAVDLSKDEAATELVDAALERLGHIDILINNAGASWGAPAEDYPLEAWDKVMNLNIRSIFQVSQAVGKRSMIPRQSGRIINIASIAGLAGNPPGPMKTIAYNTSKAAVINFTRTLAGEWGAYGINVNAIAPGFFPSKMTKGLLDKIGVDELKKDVPLRRIGDDEDLKGVTLLFASDAGKHITGQTLAVDGGVSAV